MRPARWQPPQAWSPAEQVIVKQIRRAKLFVFLRLWRHAQFSVAFQEEPAAVYQDSRRGLAPQRSSERRLGCPRMPS